ncbi:hypothetical protein TNCV_5118361 [Trichonephila clavipes]|nr:hypothetical protein TNCV_5118361 [Trichonephila clavipes]
MICFIIIFTQRYTSSAGLGIAICARYTYPIAVIGRPGVQMVKVEWLSIFGQNRRRSNYVLQDVTETDELKSLETYSLVEKLKGVVSCKNPDTLQKFQEFFLKKIFE